jgi:hypothetical protein
VPSEEKRGSGTKKRVGRPPNDDKGWQISPLTWAQIEFIKKGLLKKGGNYTKKWTIRTLKKKFRTSESTIMKARDGMLDHFFERKEDKRLARKPETVFKEKVKKWVEKLDQSYVVTIDQSALRGIPDLLCCIKGTFIGIELKSSFSETHNSSRFKLQNWYLNKIRKAGGYGFVIYPENWDKMKKIIKRLHGGIINDITEIQANQKLELQRSLEKIT